MKGIQIGKEDLKWSVDDLYLYLENLKESTKNLLELIIKPNKVGGYL